MITLAASAKINWFLNILGKREDGYHEILSLMQRITLSDTLTFEPSDAIEVLTDAEIPLPENLVYRAAMLLKSRFGISLGARITLKKETPMAAGLGGGSSDAAAALKGLDSLWSLGLSNDELAGLGGLLGSDVPFFLDGPVALVTGRGDNITPLRGSTGHALVLVKPPVGVSTAWAYSRAKAPESERELTRKRNNIKLFCHAIETGDFSSLASLQENDLESAAAARYPVIGELKRLLIRSGALFASMSGSGSTVFGVFPDEAEAEKVRASISGCWSRTVSTVTTV